MFFEVLGEADKPALLLSSGLGGSGAYWRPQLAALTKAYRVILYDHRGTGRSAGELPEAYSIEDMAEEMRQVLAAAGVERCHVMGHALGGLIALALAAAEPGLIDRMILVNAWAKADAHTLRCFAARLALLRDSGVAAYVQAQPIFLFPAWWLSQNAALVEHEVAEMIRHFPGEDSVLRRVGALKEFDMTGRLGGIGQRTLLIAARDDILVPSVASDVLAAGLPDARLVVMPQGGHACNVTFPDDFNALCLKFLQG